MQVHKLLLSLVTVGCITALACSSDSSTTQDGPCTTDAECSSATAGAVCRGGQCVNPLSDSGVDGGTVTDPEKDPQAASCSSPCVSGERCNNGSCEALYIAVTAVDTGSTSHALLLRYKEAATEVDLAPGTASKWGRFSGDGQSVAFVAGAAPTTPELRTLASPFNPASAATVNLDSPSSDFPKLEWAPADAFLWTIPGSSGSVWAASTGGRVHRASFVGGLPTWSPAGSAITYSVSLAVGGNIADSGLFTVPRAGGAAVKLSGTDSGEEPYYNGAGTHILYRKSASGGDNSDELWIYPLAGGSPVKIASAVEYSASPPTAGVFYGQGTWSPDGQYVAFIRVSYSVSGGNTIICGQPGSDCPAGTPGQQLLAQKINPTTGAAEGGPIIIEETRGALPSFSPDGKLLAYISQGKLVVKSIENGQVNSTPVFEKTLSNGAALDTTGGDDSRPRWQGFRK